jgi:hypothetical protein
MGVRITITGNTRDALVYEGTFAKSIKSGDDVMILGMPREGGFLSMTLKNEYDQVAARTVTYGSTEAGEVNYSTEKFDPTHYTWRKSSRPTIGGDERRARNHTLPGGQYIEPHVKDSDFVSVGEIQLVRKAEDWQNIGLERRGRPSTKVLKALARYFTVSGIRLDPEEQGAHISGWRPAFGIAEHSSAGTLRAGDVQWEPNIWINQTLRVMSGAQKGERFGIDASTERGVRVVGYSSPSQEELKIQAGDAFSVGPGYATPMFYTRQNGDEGIWEWQHKGLEKARYGLYVFGLNDSINTTEFLEENHNAELEVSVYNYDTREYDTLPLPGERATGSGVDPYQFVSGVNRHQYEKSDGVYCGRILPEHISPQGGIRLRLVAHALNDRDCSGFAWFDYACLTPGSANGKINVNTASERVLRALNGVSEELAANLYRGVAQSGEGSARPYRNVSDILDVRDMTPDVFTRMCNLVTTRSDQFRIHVLAQAIQDVSGDGTYDPKAGDEIIAQTRREVVVDRRELTDDDLSHGRFKVAIR